jgi:hypothetical protein
VPCYCVRAYVITCILQGVSAWKQNETDFLDQAATSKIAGVCPQLYITLVMMK